MYSSSPLAALSQRISPTSPGAREFWDPFLLPSSREMPTNFRNSFDIFLYLWILNPEYREAHNRKVSHFITALDFPGKSGDQSERREWSEFLLDQLKLFDFLNTIGQEFGCYGNGFARIFLPFDRFLVDERSGSRVEWSLSSFDPERVQYQADKLQYSVPDPRSAHLPAKKHKSVSLPFCDRRSTDMSRIKLHLIDPRYVYLMYSQWSGACRVIVQPNEEFVNAIRNNHLWEINETPLWVLQAVRDNSYLMFAPGEVFHFKAPTISGISNAGWGLPEVMANYRNMHQLAVYRKIDEAVGRDHLLPLRIFSPHHSSSVQNIADTTNLQEFKSSMAAIFAQHRKDPFSMGATPFPVMYTETSTNGKQLTTADMQRMQIDNLLNGAGYPAELFHASLQYQQMPAALRLFENANRHMFSNLSQLTGWISDYLAAFLGREKINTRLQRPLIADDMERRSIYMQMVASGEFPRRPVFELLGEQDPIEAARERSNEDVEIAKVQAKVQKDYEREQQLGSLTDQVNAQNEAQVGAAPGGVQYTPLDRERKIMEETARLLNIPDDGTRAKELAAIKATDQDMHAVIKQKMEEARAAGASQGRQQAGQLAAQAVQG